MVVSPGLLDQQADAASVFDGIGGALSGITRRAGERDIGDPV
jgi:hypothetical protein